MKTKQEIEKIADAYIDNMESRSFWDSFISGYENCQKEYEEKNKWIKVKNDFLKIELQDDILIKFKCQLNMERIVVGHIFQGRFYMNFSDNMQPLKNVIAYRYFL